MADTGYNWGSAAHAQASAADIDGTAIADEGTLTSDELSQDVKAVTYIAVISVEDDTGACDGNLNIYVLGPDSDPDSEGYESATDDTPWGTIIDQVQNTTQRRVFAVPGWAYPKFQIHLYNETGQEVAVTVNYYQATIPAAS